MGRETIRGILCPSSPLQVPEDEEGCNWHAQASHQEAGAYGHQHVDDPFVKHQKRDVWSFINNGKADEDGMRELRGGFGMDLTSGVQSMSHLEGKNRQTLSDLIKSMTAATDPNETRKARQKLTQSISDNDVGRMDVEQITTGV